MTETQSTEVVYGTENREGIPYVITTRSTRALAEKFIASYGDALGETTYWNGSRDVPVTLTWTPVRNPFTKKWQVVATCTPREI